MKLKIVQTAFYVFKFRKVVMLMWIYSMSVAHSQEKRNNNNSNTANIRAMTKSMEMDFILFECPH